MRYSTRRVRGCRVGVVGGSVVVGYSEIHVHVGLGGVG